MAPLMATWRRLLIDWWPVWAVLAFTALLVLLDALSAPWGRL